MVEDEKFEDVIEHGYYDEKTVKNPHLIKNQTRSSKAGAKVDSSK